MSTPHKIIIDTDPGQDDAVAILAALGSTELDIMGICAVAGNVPLYLTEVNARKVCEVANRTDVKVFAGCKKPMVRTLITAEEVHGRTGLDGPDLPEPTMPLQDVHAVDFIIQTLNQHPSETITICPLGPLTNVATAMKKNSSIIPKIQQIVLMGGANFENGNVTPAAEFNIYVDPQAANIVFNSGVPITVMALDVTHKALTSPSRIEAFRSIGNKAGHTVAELTTFFERFDVQKYGSEGAPLHDPCVIAYLLKPEMFSGKDVNVAVEIQSELTMGMTVVDWWHVTDRPINAHFINEIDPDGYFNLLKDKIANL